MDIFFRDSKYLGLTESIPGWYVFNKKLQENFTSIPVNWDFEIAVPAFKTMLTLLYDRDGRMLEEAEAVWYTR